jgi:NDP-sugar pyrophosphorylase family protein
VKAMIFAAGMGTRLKPLTDDRPKALVTVAGRTMLEIALLRLRDFYIDEVIINTHHYAQMVADYLAANRNFGMKITLAHEEVLLDTGGGLKNVADFFLSTDSQESFLLHNVDVLSTIDLNRMLAFHQQQKAVATLAVQHRPTSRYLLFDEQGHLCGRRVADSEGQRPEPINRAEPLAFSGIHIVSPRLLSLVSEEGAFSIIPTYLRLAAQGEKIVAFQADGAYWRDLGKPESVRQATQDVADGVYPAVSLDIHRE